jgi:hypothetical protein
MLDDEQAIILRREQGASAAKPPFVPVSPVAETSPGAVAAPAPSERRILVSAQAIERLYEIVPGWDKYYLEHAYIDWAKDKEPARNEDARFLSWVGSYTKGKASP